MSGLTIDASQNGNVKNVDNRSTSSSGVVGGVEIEELDFSKLLDRPRPLNIERDRQRSFDERSLSELAIGVSPRLSARGDNSAFRGFDHIESVYSPGRRSGYNTPRSNPEFETHPTVAEAWDALRRSLVHFRGQPVGTIAALDNSEEKLNYDQMLPEQHENEKSFKCSEWGHIGSEARNGIL